MSLLVAPTTGSAVWSLAAAARGVGAPSIYTPKKLNNNQMVAAGFGGIIFLGGVGNNLLNRRRPTAVPTLGAGGCVYPSMC